MIAGIVIPVVGVLVVFTFAGWVRYLRHLEYVAYYEALGRAGALSPPQDQGTPSNAAPVIPPPGRLPSLRPRTPEPWARLRRGVTTGAVGLALLVGLGTLGFGPWLLGGLVPLFFGLVEIVFAVVEQRHGA